MKYITLTSLLLFATSMNISAMESEDSITYLLPSANMLSARLSTIPECKHFIDNSPIIPRFADQKQYAAAVFMIVGFEKENYGKKFANMPTIDKSLFQIEAVKPRMVELILQEHPAAIAYLKKKNIMIDPILFESEEIVRKKLIDAGFDYFATKSSVAKLLANQRKYPTEVWMIIVNQMEELIKPFPNRMMKNAQLELRPMIVETLLKEYPKAIDCLRMDNWID